MDLRTTHQISNANFDNCIHVELGKMFEVALTWAMNFQKVRMRTPESSFYLR